jgi:hypothetical protein
MFLSKENGFYVDVGASDGRAASNTYHLEKFQNWQGVLIEPTMHVYFRSREIRSLKRNIFSTALLFLTITMRKQLNYFIQV